MTTAPPPPTGPSRVAPLLPRPRAVLTPLPGIDLPTPWRLAPGVELLWRGDGTFQLEHLDGGVVVEGLDRAVAADLARSGRRGHTGGAAPEATAHAAPADLAALHRLAELGYLEPGPPGPGARPPRLRLAADGAAPAGPGAPVDPGYAVVLGAAGADLGDGDDAVDDGTGPADPRAEAARRRASLRAARVEVVGLTAAGAYVGALLAAGGVGSVRFASTGAVRRRHLLPGGLSRADEGRRFAAAAADVVARVAPRTHVGPSDGTEPDLVVLCLDAPAEPDLRDLLHRTRRAHLVVHVDATRGEVGPLVIPGVSACLRCADLHRLDHDPAWTVLAVQLLARAGGGPVPEPSLSARTAALGANLAVRWLAGDPLAGRTLDGSWELRRDDVTPRHRDRRAHPDCPCQAAEVLAAPA